MANVWKSAFLNPSLKGSPEGALSENRRLILYGGGDFRDNSKLNKRLIALTEKKQPSITYIPSSSDYGRFEFVTFVEQFQKYKLNRFQYLPLDLPVSETLLKESLKADIVFLSGGNTFYFLKSLRAKGMIERLREFAKGGGVLGGLSAGAILLTPRIQTAAYPSFDRDPNAVGIRNLKSLGIVDFEFFPHYSNSHRYRKALETYSKKLEVPLYGAPDGSGLVVRGREVQFVGKNTVFFGGMHFPLAGEAHKR